MTTQLKISCLLIALMLSASCAENKRPKQAPAPKASTLNPDREMLKFNSGIRAILHDSKGNYWFGSDQEGVCKYDGKTFAYYSPANGFCSKQVIHIEEDTRGVIWFGTSSGLCSYDGVNFNVPEPDLPLNPGSVAATELWFPGNQRNQIIGIEQGNIHVYQSPLIVPEGENPANHGITGFSKGKNGNVWIAHYAGVIGFDGERSRHINNSTMHFDGKTRNMHVRSILEDSKGRLWIGNNGIGVQLKEKDTIVDFSAKHGLAKGDVFAYPASPGTLLHVFAIHEDAQGNIWFGDRDTGAWRYDGNSMVNFTVDSTLGIQHIWDIYEDKNGNLLFAMAESWVYRFNGTGFERVF